MYGSELALTNFVAVKFAATWLHDELQADAVHKRLKFGRSSSAIGIWTVTLSARGDRRALLTCRHGDGTKHMSVDVASNKYLTHPHRSFSAH